VITGFLGSGKTTLIRRLLRDPAFAETAVIVNEFGEIGLDHLLVESAREDVLLLEGGCLCCASQGDLARALRSLLDRSERGELPPFRRVVVETSGLADPGPILGAMMTDPLRLSRYRFASIAACVDGLLGAGTLRRHGEAARQVLMSDRIVLTKSDIADGKQQETTLAAIRSVTAAPVDMAPGGGLGATLFAEPGRNIVQRNDQSAHRHGDYLTVARRTTRPLRRSIAESWVARSAASLGPNLLRLKALLTIEGEDAPTEFHAVQHIVHLPRRLAGRPGSQWDTGVVLIAEGVSERKLGQIVDELDMAVD